MQLSISPPRHCKISQSPLLEKWQKLLSPQQAGGDGAMCHHALTVSSQLSNSQFFKEEKRELVVAHPLHKRTIHLFESTDVFG